MNWPTAAVLIAIVLAIAAIVTAVVSRPRK